MIRVLIVFGTRPEALKLMPIIRELSDRPGRFEVAVAVTAQHRDMLDQVLSRFEIAPAYDLDLMKPGQDLYSLTGQIVEGMKGILRDARPDVVIVQGDTTTAFAAALASYYNQTPVAHVEAGLRTENIYSPFPEEMNRRLVSRIATFHFPPTELNQETLIHEGVSPDKTLITGNPIIDTLMITLAKIDHDPSLAAEIRQTVLAEGYPHADEGEDRYVLVTSHRRENHGGALRNICSALRELAETHPSVDLVFPVHKNPSVREVVQQELTGLPNIYLLEPLDYFSFVYLLRGCHFVMTDSGGIQEEAPSLKKPVIVMRDATERVEAQKNGNVKVVGTEARSIVEEARAVLEQRQVYESYLRNPNPFGDGTASVKIADYLSANL